MRFALAVVIMLFVAVFTVSFTGPAWAVDLSKIERVIAKEPAYGGQPLYALLVFGPEAAKRVLAGGGRRNGVPRS